MDVIIRDFSYQNWITILVFLCLLSLAVAKSFYYQQFADFISLKGADRYIFNRTRGSFFFEPLQLVLITTQFIGISLFIYTAYCALYNLSFDDNVYIFGYVLLGYTIFEIVRFLLERLVAFIFGIYRFTRPYLYKKLNIKNILGLFALCFGAIIAYYPELPDNIIYAMAGIIIFIFVISLLWLIKAYRDQLKRFPIYFILYFCTLEIAPYLILYVIIANG